MEAISVYREDTDTPTLARGNSLLVFFVGIIRYIEQSDRAKTTGCIHFSYNNIIV